MSEVAAGHAARGEGHIFLVDDDAETPQAILKQLDEGEVAVYDSLWNDYADDSVLPFVAKFEGVCEVLDEKGAMCKYLRMTNLLKDFRRPKVMDVKLGIRTFLEMECNNSKLRPDLYQRMLKLFPSQVTEDDRLNQGITKLRWMNLRDMSSTIRTLGFRIDGIAGHKRTEKELSDQLARLRQRSEACDEFCRFMKVAANDDGREPNGVNAVELAERVFDMLLTMHTAFENSAFVQCHECIGSSVLLVADAYGKAGVFWIDFGKTKPLPYGLEVSHRKSWEPGNHEDGILTGLDNLVLVWGDVVDILRRDPSSSSVRGTAKGRSFSGHIQTPRQESSQSRTVQPTQRRSRTSPHHGWESECGECPYTSESQMMLTEEDIRRSIFRTVFQRIIDHLAGLCGYQRPKQVCSC